MRVSFLRKKTEICAVTCLPQAGLGTRPLDLLYAFSSHPASSATFVISTVFIVTVCAGPGLFLGYCFFRRFFSITHTAFYKQVTVL